MFEYIHHIAHVVSDKDGGLRVFRDTFELELSDRRIIEGETSVEMAAFRCGPTSSNYYVRSTIQHSLNLPRSRGQVFITLVLP